MSKLNKLVAAFAAGACALAISTAAASARDEIRIVGSSTVFPFSTTVAERFGKETDFPTPVIESTGTGGGLKLFCAGVGEAHPDITNASARIKQSQIDDCAANGIKDIVEVKIGYDGIVIANSRESDALELTLQDVFLALAKDVPAGEDGKTQANPYMMWSDIRPELPKTKIEVLGPPPTSGTRAAFVEIAMEGGCKSFSWIKDLKKADKSAYKQLCHTIREDGAFIEAGENDNLIVQKLQAAPTQFGIFGFSFLDQNSDVLQGALVDGVAPEFEKIAAGDYPVSRSLFFYVKKAHVGVVPGMEEFLAAFANDEAWGDEGYLTEKGLIPMGDEERATVAKTVADLAPMSM
ncbi:substrate-binding domain-containing protein [Lentilitoribacter sp. Alg239-R112]|uniref:substrate-binding domain-containing protein n=1 Tax=Lentilitoribacter sp. Alg239-R112 TaxID=2305987 RepID=UPI0013A68EBC|nr:substrate-binding domain-containing protein [Lentilitoribacter sp. Alg239-R112]